MPLETLENKNLVSQRNFLDDNLRLEALTHKSFHYENPSNGPHNERLEFLGDSIVSFVVANYLFGRFPHFKEGQLTLLRANLVCKKKLAQFALQLGLDSEIRLGVGALRDGGRASEKVLEDAFEAYIGAVFLDSGSSLYAVQEFMEPLLTPAVDKLTRSSHCNHLKYEPPNNDLQDPINKLQTWSQRRGLGIPVYVPFCVEVIINGKRYGCGQARNKKDAKKDAAINALKLITMTRNESNSPLPHQNAHYNHPSSHHQKSHRISLANNFFLVNPGATQATTIRLFN
nr:2933_t:CDS:2 [Entrophospora candida]